MNIKTIHDKTILLEFLQEEAGLQIYLIGDLDDFFWQSTNWYGLYVNNKLKAVALLYCSSPVPTLLCFQRKEAEHAFILLNKIKNLLPPLFNAHLGEGLVEVFGKENVKEHYGINLKMVLTQQVAFMDDPNIRRLNPDDMSTALNFYSAAYPNNWFDIRMLETGKYFGYFLNHRLVGIAGIHVYSAEYRVAALGNIAIHPECRNRGIGYRISAALCHDLQKDVDVVGLNVRSDNPHAIRLYEKLGFKTAGIYEECLLVNISG